MAWNQPGGGGDRDPWGSRNNGQQGQGPPDLDEVLKQLQNRVRGIFGGGSGKNGSGSGGGPSLSGIGATGIGLILVVLVALWAMAGVYIVEPAEEGVVLRFGKFHASTTPGPHWAPYLIDTVEKVNVEAIRRAEIGFRSNTTGSIASESLMLTRDENIVDIQFAVQYRVRDAKNYLFEVLDADTTLSDATESAVREVVGKSDMDFVITGGRSDVASQVQTLTQEILDRYNAGLTVTTVNMQSAQPPAQVQEAFADAVRAREDEERVKNEAKAFAADILPKARGEANAVLERAEAYKQRVIALATGQASRFTSVYSQYKKAPEVTRQRLYLDAVESVMTNSSKVLVDVKGGNNLLYFPIDKLIAPRTADGTAEPTDRRSYQENAPGRTTFDSSRNRQATGRDR
ncbi:MAG: membrane protease subunit HflK [Gammaproteobacteria bacterium]|jgi:membrane protease subunit HflK